MRPCLPLFLWQAADAGCAGGAPDADESDLERALQGDQDAFEHLVRRYHRPLISFLRLYVPEVVMAEDAAQETWIAVLKGVSSFEGRASFRTWLFKVGARRARDLSRKLGRDEERTRSWVTAAQIPDQSIRRSRFLPDDHPDYPEHWAESPDPRRSAGPEDELLQREAATRVTEELERLPPAMAAVVTLRDFAGLNGAETATAVGLSEANQRVLLHRARLRLWAAWENYEAENE